MGFGLDTHPLQEIIIDTSGAGDNVIVPGIPGKVISVYRLFFVCDSATDVTFQDGALTPFTGAMSMLASGAIVFDFTTTSWFTCTAGNDFVINLTAPSGIRGRLYFTQG